MGRFLIKLNRLIWWLVLILGVFAGVLWVILYSQTGMTPKLEYTARLFSIAALLIIMTVIIAFVHELGHAIAAWLVGYRVHMIAVMSLGYTPSTRRFHRIRDHQLHELGGFVVASSAWQKWGKWKDVFLYSGGVLACILFAVCVYLFDVFSGYGANASVYAALAIVAVTLPNLVPFTFANKVATDGKLILNRLMGKSDPKEMWLKNRVWAAQNGYLESSVSNEEWADIQALNYSDQSLELCFLLKMAAWERTDIAAYMAVHAAIQAKGQPSESSFRYQDLVMTLLADRDLDPELQTELQAEFQNDAGSMIYHFARALFANRFQGRAAAIKAAQAARRQYELELGHVPEGEAAIFLAIERGDALPV